MNAGGPDAGPSLCGRPPAAVSQAGVLPDVGPSRSLKQRALSAGGWSAAGFALGQGMRVVSTLVMTRLLAPEMFGVMSIAIMVNVIASLLTDLGIKQNIVQSRRGEDP